MEYIVKTPYGNMCASLSHLEGSIIKLYWQLPSEIQNTNKSASTFVPRQIVELQLQLNEYFKGKLKSFSVPIDLRGTPFQKKVWQVLLSIPFGETRTYQDIALLIDQPHASRAVGQANRRNPLHVIIPCHRIISKKGQLNGYVGSGESGLQRKKQLLLAESRLKKLSN